jgi:signal transduction histidine kinase
MEAPAGGGAHEDDVARTMAALEQLAVVEQVTSALGHEVRNRLGAIRNAAFYLERRAKQSDFWNSDPRIATFFELIANEADSSHEWFDECLRTAREIERHPRRLDASTSVGVAAQHALRNGGSRLEIEALPGDVNANPEELVLGIRCLLDNALDATPSGRRVQVRAGPTADGRYRIAVRDEGPGFPEQGRDAFRAFTSTKVGHLGLGLNIATRIARRYGGDVEVDATGRGACVLLWLPLAGSPPEAGAP